MAENGTSAVNVNLDLTKPATVLVEKIAGAIGIIYEPRRIKKRAVAEADAKITIAKADEKVISIQHRAMNRLQAEEVKKQKNIESVIEKTLPQLELSSDPAKLSDDWITHFFELSRMTSDSEMQDLWARILAGESNKPGSFSRRTVNLVSEFDKNDAELFSLFSNYVWRIADRVTPLVYDENNEIYYKNGINFDTISHLEALGLIRFDTLGYWITFNPPGAKIPMSYGKNKYQVQIPNGQESKIETGKVILTAPGKELLVLCSPVMVIGLLDYVKQKMESTGKILQVVTL